MIVADAGPLIALGRLDWLMPLSKIVGKILIPKEVENECLGDANRPGAQAIYNASLQGIILTRTLKKPISQELDNLDCGEAAAITLAQHLSLPLLIDERMGRRTAENLGLGIIGTAGVLLQAKRLGIINEVRPTLYALHDMGYRLSADLIKEIMRLASET